MDPRSVLEECRGSWKPPAELERSRPRECRLTAAGKALLGLSVFLLVAAIGAGVALHLKATGDRQERRALMERGAPAQGEVTRRWINRGKNTKYWVAYRYRIEGRSYDFRMETGRGDWQKLSEESTLSIRFLPENPGSHYVEGFEEQLLPLWVPYIVGIVLAGTGWLVHRLLRIQRRLLQEGRAVPGVITEHRKTKDGKVARYVFLQLSGSQGEGKMSPRKNPPEIGSLVCVLYEPDRVKNNGVYPLTLVRSIYAENRRKS
jgi:hypothetical protein